MFSLLRKGDMPSCRYERAIRCSSLTPDRKEHLATAFNNRNAFTFPEILKITRYKFQDILLSQVNILVDDV